MKYDKNTGAEVIRFESRFKELPIVGKLPSLIFGSQFKCEAGIINLADYYNCFIPLKWYERRELVLTKVKCIQYDTIGAYSIKPGEEYDVVEYSQWYSYGADKEMYDVYIRVSAKHDKSDIARIGFHASNFKPIEYQIEKDVPVW